MSKAETLEEIKQTLGLVPGFFEMMPEDSIEFEWRLFKRYTMQKKSEIPPKYRHLIGLAAAAARQCWYCVNFHTGMAKHIYGATDAEIEETVHTTKFGSGWSAYLNGSLYDKEKFMQELHAVAAYLTK